MRLLTSAAQLDLARANYIRARRSFALDRPWHSLSRPRLRDKTPTTVFAVASFRPSRRCCRDCPPSRRWIRRAQTQCEAVTCGICLVAVPIVQTGRLEPSRPACHTTAKTGTSVCRTPWKQRMVAFWHLFRPLAVLTCPLPSLTGLMMFQFTIDSGLRVRPSHHN